MLRQELSLLTNVVAIKWLIPLLLFMVFYHLKIDYNSQHCLTIKFQNLCQHNWKMLVLMQRLSIVFVRFQIVSLQKTTSIFSSRRSHMKPELATWLKLVRAAYLNVFPPSFSFLISPHSLTLKIRSTLRFMSREEKKRINGMLFLFSQSSVNLVWP